MSITPRCSVGVIKGPQTRRKPPQGEPPRSRLDHGRQGHLSAISIAPGPVQLTSAWQVPPSSHTAAHALLLNGACSEWVTIWLLLVKTVTIWSRTFKWFCNSTRKAGRLICKRWFPAQNHCYPNCTGLIKQKQKPRQQEKCWQQDDTSPFSLSRADLGSWPRRSRLPNSEIWPATTVQERGQDQKALANIHNLFIRNRESHFTNFIFTGTFLCSCWFSYLMVNSWRTCLLAQLSSSVPSASCFMWEMMTS